MGKSNEAQEGQVADGARAPGGSQNGLPSLRNPGKTRPSKGTRLWKSQGGLPGPPASQGSCLLKIVSYRNHGRLGGSEAEAKIPASGRQEGPTLWAGTGCQAGKWKRLCPKTQHLLPLRTP